MDRVIFWDVDTQYDFIMPDGKLYVPEAETTIPNLRELTALARRLGIQIMGSVDYHLETDEEISNHPDYKTTFPAHCLQGTAGQEKIEATRPINPLWIDSVKYDSAELEGLIARHKGEIIFRKQKFDVFSNPNVIPVLDLIKPDVIFVYGVALDVCDAYAIEGFLKLGRQEIYLVTDAAKPIYQDKGNELLEMWKKRGVRMTSTKDIKELRVEVIKQLVR
ncbi:MAG: cysteine hydrolase family protein [Candidatus Kryptoniota bacterium]